MLRNLSRLAGVAAISLVAAAPAAAAEPAAIKPAVCSANATLTAFSDALDKTEFAGTNVGGISALAPRPFGRVRALVDNEKETPARAYDLTLGDDGELDPTVRRKIALRRADGTPYTGADLDAEGLVSLPSGDMLLSSEIEPSIKRFNSQGRERQWGSLPVPERFRVAPEGDSKTNQTLEGLGLSRDARDLWAGMEGPLAGDGTAVRFLHYKRRLARYVPAGQIGYQPDDKLGVTETQVLPDGSLLVLERGFNPETGNTVRIYQAFPDDAEDVTDVASLATPGVRLAPKRLLVDLGDCPPSGATAPGTQKNPLLDNIESMLLAPDGRTLLLASDDNFNPKQTTRLYRLEIEPFAAPKPAVRFAQFNSSLNRPKAGELEAALRSGSDPQIKNVAEIIQRTRPDVLALQEFDFIKNGVGARLFQNRYLAVSQNGAKPIFYPYRFAAPSNTGVASGKDLDNNGKVVTEPGTPDYANDALGFGLFEGQYGQAVFSRLPIERDGIRTFQKFLWKDMPDALLPPDWFTSDELDVVRLSSKSHWDVPIKVNGETVHFLVSHPTPPTFDGPEDRNGRRNHDEIRLWSDYVTPGKGDYLYDDAGKRGGLPEGERFVIAGDMNADPVDGDSTDGAILQLLDNPLINATGAPASPGGPEQAKLQGGANATQKGDPAFDTADFSDTAPGNLRVDYVLPDRPSEIARSFVFWPLAEDPLSRLTGTYDPKLTNGFPSSDHRLVGVDLRFGGDE